MTERRLQIEQLERSLGSIQPVPTPPAGWIKAVRTALGMTQQQLADRLSVTKQSLQEIEKREQSSTVTLDTLRRVADALDMQLVYALIPEDGSFNALIERRAYELAQEIVGRTAASMSLEDQANSDERLRQAVEERAAQFQREIPKALWR